MDFKNLAQKRHSVRRYIKKAIPSETLKKLKDEIKKVNSASKLDIQMVTGDSSAFDKFLIGMAYIKNCENYLVMIGNKSDDLEERVGYYGEYLVLFLQGLGLNTCWVAGTYNKSYVKANVVAGQKLVCLIAFGFGENCGTPHVGKGFSYICKSIYNEIPTWFESGVDCALLAPTARNQQKFRFEFVEPNTVKAYTRPGRWTKIDLGIAKYHFELGAGKDNFVWAKPKVSTIKKIVKALKK